MDAELKCAVDFIWDEESSVWIATSEDVEGLVLEGGSLDALIERVRHAVPELLELNKRPVKTIDLTFTSTRNDRVALYG